MTRTNRTKFSSLFAGAYSRKTIIMCGLGACVASIVGPFGTYEAGSLFQHLPDWLVLIFSMNFTVYAVYAMLGTITGTVSTARFKLALFVLGTIVGATVLYGFLSFAIGTTQFTWIRLLGYMASVLGAIISFEYVLTRDRNKLDDNADAEMSVPSAVPQDRTSRLAKRFEFPQEADILRVSADGHFVEIKTTSTTARRRLRFADALAELDDLEGVVTHRSHWVAREAIRGWNPDKIKPHVVLKDGEKVPVSKTHREKIEALQLLEITEADLVA